MPLIYRAMLRDGNKPKVGPTKKTLGVKPGSGLHDDIAPDGHGNVSAGGGGMSVSTAWRDLPAHRIPERLKPRCAKAAGNNNYTCWRMGDGPFENGDVTDALVLSVDRMVHGTVEPAFVMLLEKFQQALAETQDRWSIDEV